MRSVGQAMSVPALGWGCGFGLFDAWPWGSFHLRGARELWEVTPGRSRVVVAVIDDGFDVSHPALRPVLWRMPGQPAVHGWNFVEGNDDVSPAAEVPVSSHGTMVSGIIGGWPERAESFAGVAPNAVLMLLRWRSNQPAWAHANPACMAAALRFAVEHGAQVVNISASIDMRRKSAAGMAELRDAFVLAEKRGVLVVVAAPNHARDMDVGDDCLPGVFPFANIIQVTGLCREGRLTGSWGARTVDIAAPGEGICGPVVGGGYGCGGTTSFAAPLVSGALALVWGLLPGLGAEEIRRLILGHARRGAGVGRGLESVDEDHRDGGGRVKDFGSGWQETWGREAPAVPEGRLDLGFVGEVWERYWSGRAREGQ
jgi:subtilisin family serine protease